MARAANRTTSAAGHVARLAVAIVLAASSVRSAAQAVDLAGRWRVQFGSLDELVDITHVASTLTIPTSVCTFTGVAQSPFSLTSTGCGLGALEGFTSSDNSTLLATAFYDLLSPPLTMFATRCECDDGNTVDGDGCDAGCRIEPCFTCSGMPSVCAPSGDGATCDDGSDCTTGETCSAGVCGGGTPLSPCSDMSGQWDVRLTVDLGGPEAPEAFDLVWNVEQRGGTIVVDEGGSPIWLGSIDPSTGMGDVSGIPAHFGCQPIQKQTTLNVDPSGDLFVGGGYIGAAGPTFICSGFSMDVIGARSGTQVCGDGVLLPPEQCDDGNTSPGDCCGATCLPETDGSACDDGDACTITSCQSGACEVDGAVTCPACESCDSLDGCVPSPQTAPACVQPGVRTKSVLILGDRADDSRDLVAWKWRRGPDTSAAELGDPLGADDYELCVFDESGPSPTILFRATAPAGGTCDGKPCWKGLGKPPGDSGYKYKDREASPDGLIKLIALPGPDGKATIAAKGKGAKLVMPGENEHPVLPVPEPVAVRAQLRAGNGTCWEATYSEAGTKRNDSAVFKSRGD
jgi:cysteine-rich repeat protein